MSDDIRTINVNCDDDDPALRSLLELGRVQADRPTARLSAQLNGVGGDDWVAEVMSVAPDGQACVPSNFIDAEVVEIDWMRTQYQHAKRMFHEGQNEQVKLAGLLWYLLLMAAAAAHHSVLLSSQPTAMTSAALMDVSPDLPDPWSDLAAQGAISIDAST
ncbi:MAG: hypothetical protein P8I91_06380 [Phycisphaerales bacterium]|nr:hypothetical protein [Phycisphaerales bacterium]